MEDWLLAEKELLAQESSPYKAAREPWANGTEVDRSDGHRTSCGGWTIWQLPQPRGADDVANMSAAVVTPRRKAISDFPGSPRRSVQDTGMRRRGRGSLVDPGDGWISLLRVTARAFVGELSLSLLTLGKGIKRRLRLAARLCTPGLSPHKRKRLSRLMAPSRPSQKPFEQGVPTLLPPRPRDPRTSGSAPPR